MGKAVIERIRSIWEYTLHLRAGFFFLVFSCYFTVLNWANSELSSLISFLEDQVLSVSNIFNLFNL